MLLFSDSAGGLVFTCGFSVLSVIGVTLFLFARASYSFRRSTIIVFITLILSFLLGFLISRVLIRVTQQSVIAPQVQTVLDQTCGENKYIATEGEFYDDSRFYWKSADATAQCYSSNQGWICSCAPK